MKRLLTIAMVLGLAGCSKSAVDAVKDWADGACKCKDEACAKKSKEAFDALEHKYKKEFDNESTAKAADEHLERANKCLAEFDVSAG